MDLTLLCFEDLNPQTRISFEPRAVASIPAAEELLKILSAVAATAHYPDLSPPPELPERKIGKFLYLPVEVAPRELAAKARLAGEMSRRGFQVLVGSPWEIGEQKYADLPPGIVLFKTLNALDSLNMYQAGRAGHLICCQNEELLAMEDSEKAYRLNCHDAALRLVDRIFAHSEESARILRKLADPRKVKVTGSPRTSERIAWDRDGDIVVCTQAATINNEVPLADYCRMIFKSLKKPVPDVEAITRQQIEHERKYYDLTMDIAHELHAEFGNRVVLRPHPCESRERYYAERMRVENETSFSEQLKKTSVVVFVSGCGTGYEAREANIPSVRIGTGGLGKSGAFGEPALNGKDAVHAVRAALAGAQDCPAQKPCSLNLADEIHSLWRANSYPMPFDIEHAWISTRTEEFKPHPMQSGKFPPMLDEDLAALCGAAVKRVGWRAWILGEPPK